VQDNGMLVCSGTSYSRALDISNQEAETREMGNYFASQRGSSLISSFAP
jgi:hypothetical protein